MLNFVSIPLEDRQALVTKFSKYDEDPISLEPVIHPCFAILKNKDGTEYAHKEHAYNVETLLQLMDEDEPLCPFSSNRIVGQVGDQEGEGLIKQVREALINAVNNEKEMAAWLQAGGNPNQILVVEDENSFVNRSPLLHAACFIGCRPVVSLLLPKAKTNQLQEVGANSGTTPLFIATLKGHADIIEWLVEFGAEVDKHQGSGSFRGISALYYAASTGNKALVETLLNNGADVNLLQGEGSHKGKSALFVAAMNGHTGIVKLLIDQGADVFAVDVALKTTKNRASHFLIAEKRLLINQFLEEMERTILSKRTNDSAIMTPTQAIRRAFGLGLTNDKLRLNLQRKGLKITQLKRSFNDICSKIAETNLSLEAITAAIEELSLPPAAPAVETGAPIVTLAKIRSRRRKADSERVSASSSSKEEPLEDTRRRAPTN